MDDPRELVGKNVARLRGDAGLSQVQLAKQLGPYNLGVTQGYLSELESRRKNPTLLTLSAIAEALDATLSDLVMQEGKKRR